MPHDRLCSSTVLITAEPEQRTRHGFPTGWRTHLLYRPSGMCGVCASQHPSAWRRHPRINKHTSMPSPPRSPLQDAYQARLRSMPPGTASSGIPPREWPGWVAVAEDLDLWSFLDHATFRVRQATKIAVAAEVADLSGKEVDWASVEARVCAIIMGSVSLTQLPNTVRNALRVQPWCKRTLAHFWSCNNAQLPTAPCTGVTSPCVSGTCRSAPLTPCCFPPSPAAASGGGPAGPSCHSHAGAREA